jgi:processive 1,2-diacylglycerol beta-glucosyltransferase
MSTRVLILSSAVGAGHIAAAAALERAFRAVPGVEVRNLDAMSFSTRAHLITYTLYFPASRVAPWLMEWGYEHSNQPFVTDPLLPLWDRLNAPALLRAISDYRPHIAVCTHFMPARAVGHLIARGRLDTSLEIVTTDYDVHGSFLSDTFSRYFVALEEGRERCRALGIAAERVVATGIPVDPAFEEPRDRAALLAALGLQPDLPIILVSAGAAGGGSVELVVRQLMQVRRAIQVVVVCGRNEALRRRIDDLTAGYGGRFRAVGFTRQMPDLMRLASLFIGKPGGLTSAECMAAGLPMLIVEPLPGQEERNADHLLEAGAAARCHELNTLAYKVDLLLGEAGRLERLSAGARRFGRPGAARAIVEAVLAEPLPALTLSRAQRRRMAAIARAY